MLLTLLGSAAAEGWPALYCTCDYCSEALRRGQKDIRRRTSYRLGDRIQIDFGPDTYGACLAFGLDTSTLTDLIVTHNHSDHFTPHELFYRRPGFSAVAEDSMLSVHGPEGVGEALSEHLGDLETYRLQFRQMELYTPRELADGVVAVALPAAHAKDIGGSYNYLFTIGSRQLLLAHDTGWWEDEVWGYLASRGIDMAIFDCTYGARQERRGHLGAPDVVQMRDTLRESGALAPDCRAIANHFSHNGYWLHSDLEEFFGPQGIEVGYDGMQVEI